MLSRSQDPATAVEAARVAALRIEAKRTKRENRLAVLIREEILAVLIRNAVACGVDLFGSVTPH
jgi:hypothetical protein